MKSISEGCQSGQLLSKAVEDFSKSLDAIFEPQPSDPRLGFFNAASSVVFFARCVLSEMLECERLDLSGTNAIGFAISVADYNSTAKLLRVEIEEISREDSDYLPVFLGEIRKMMDERKLGPEWLALLDT